MRNSCFCPPSPLKKKKNVGLACDEINGDYYEKYFVEQLLGNISPQWKAHLNRSQENEQLLAELCEKGDRQVD
jgi:hypothetical protein